MHAASLVNTPTSIAPVAAVPMPEDDTHALGESIAALAARIHAATFDLLVMLAEFDARKGWNTGFLSCAHWLHSTPTRTGRASGAPAWRTGIDLGAAREKVRVARALPALSRVSAEMQRGRLSYAKVRALTRVATPDNEQALVGLALAGTAAHVERFVRGWRRVDAVSDRATDEARHLARGLSTWADDDGMVVIRGRFTPEVGALVQRALEAAADTLFRDSASAAKGVGMAEEVNHAQRRADALGLIAETALSAGLDAGTAGDRYQVVVHVSAETSNGGGQDAAIEVDHGALHVSAETWRRLACDASVVRIDHDASGDVRLGGGKTRTIPPSIRRALAARDTGCRFPGCTSRRCDAHHIEHWADGGATAVDNLILLCRRHHRAVHEGGFELVRHADGSVSVRQPDGHVIPPAPVLDDIDLEGTLLGGARPIEPPPAWDGTPFDLAWAIDVLYRRERKTRR